MGFEVLAIRNPSLSKDLLALASVYDMGGQMQKPLEVYASDFASLKRMGISELGSHPIVCGKKKFKRNKRVQECLF